MPIDSCTVPGKDDPQRDYLAEARAIVSGSSRLMAEPDHLRAVFALVAEQQANVLQLSELVTAFMVERQQPNVLVQKGILDEVRAKQLHLLVNRTDRGVEVRVRVREGSKPLVHG